MSALFYIFDLVPETGATLGALPITPIIGQATSSSEKKVSGKFCFGYLVLIKICTKTVV